MNLHFFQNVANRYKQILNYFIPLLFYGFSYSAKIYHYQHIIYVIYIYIISYVFKIVWLIKQAQMKGYQ